MAAVNCRSAGEKKHCRKCYCVLIAAALCSAAFKQTSHLDVDGECLVAFQRACSDKLCSRAVSPLLTS